MGKSTISMVIFNSYVKLPEGTWFMVAKQPVIGKFLNNEIGDQPLAMKKNTRKPSGTMT